MKTKMLVLLLTLLVLSSQATAVIGWPSNGYKGSISIVVPYQTIDVSSDILISFDSQGPVVRRVKETVTLYETRTEHFWNCVPMKIDFSAITNSSDTISFYSVFVEGLDDGSQFKPLKANETLDSIQMKDGYGNWHTGTVHNCNSIYNLPTSTANGVTYEWDNSNWAQTSGNIQYGKVDMTLDEFLVPEPATLCLLGLGGFLLGRRHKS